MSSSVKVYMKVFKLCIKVNISLTHTHTHTQTYTQTQTHTNTPVFAGEEVCRRPDHRLSQPHHGGQCQVITDINI